MSPRQKKSGVSVASIKKTAKPAAKKTAAHAGARVKHARATVKQSPGRAKRFLNSTPVRVLLGASAVALVVAKLKHLV